MYHRLIIHIHLVKCVYLWSMYNIFLYWFIDKSSWIKKHHILIIIGGIHDMYSDSLKCNKLYLIQDIMQSLCDYANI